MPDATPPPRFESTVSPPSRPGYATPGSTAAGTLGVRADLGLQDAFIGGVGTTGEAQQAALTEARAIMDREADFAGPDANPLFPEYRRNFHPASTAEAYASPRDKSDVATIDGTGLGTPYTPTIASPGESEGISPTNLRSVRSKATQVNKLPLNDLDNPANPQHQNNPDQPLVGTVRRFILGVGSTAGLEPADARAQFPRPPR